MVRRRLSQALFSGARTRGNRHNLKHRRFPPTIRKHFFTVRVTGHWHMLPREVILKSCLDMVLGNWPCLSSQSSMSNNTTASPTSLSCWPEVHCNDCAEAHCNECPEAFNKVSATENSLVSHPPATRHHEQPSSVILPAMFPPTVQKQLVRHLFFPPTNPLLLTLFSCETTESLYFNMGRGDKEGEGEIDRGRKGKGKLEELEETNKRKSRRESRQQTNTRKRKDLLHKWVNQHLRRQMKVWKKGLQDSCEKLKQLSSLTITHNIATIQSINHFLKEKKNRIEEQELLIISITKYILLMQSI
ncbi:LOW QUALITY PROTEIN: hypothetical protein QYF61_021415, partial [Mycteria americana]